MISHISNGKVYCMVTGRQGEGIREVDPSACEKDAQFTPQEPQADGRARVLRADGTVDESIMAIVGKKVTIKGLQNATQFNGQLGTIIRPSGMNGTYVIYLDSDQSEIACKKKNFDIVGEESVAPPPSFAAPPPAKNAPPPRPMPPPPAFAPTDLATQVAQGLEGGQLKSMEPGQRSQPPPMTPANSMATQPPPPAPNNASNSPRPPPPAPAQSGGGVPPPPAPAKASPPPPAPAKASPPPPAPAQATAATPPPFSPAVPPPPPV